MSNLNPPPASSASRFSSLVSTFVSRHDSVSTQTPVYAKPMFCVSSSCFSFASFVAMCWVRLCPRLAQHAHVLFLFPFPLWCSQSVCSVILTPSTFLYLIQVACQSTCFCAEHHLHVQPVYVWPFPTTLVHTLLRFNFKPLFTQTPCFV